MSRRRDLVPWPVYLFLFTILALGLFLGWLVRGLACG